MGSDDGYSQRLSSLLSAKDRDFLIRRNVDQVKIGSLAGKPLGLYFSASGCKPSQGFTPLLLQAYEDLTKSKSDFEVVFVSSDEDEESFDHYFSKMPWLAVPFSDSDTRAGLRELFKVKATPHLVILDKQGKVSCHGGVKIVTKYGARGYPFTEEKLKFLSEEQENAKKNQTLTSLLASPTRDYLISNDGTETAVHELEGKMVLLYITSHDVPSCAEFTPKLVDFYKKVKENGEGNFEVVLVSFDSTEEKYRTWFETMPWLAVPFQDKTCGKLLDYFQVRSAPTVIVIGRDGKTMNPNVAELIEEFGIVAYPFSPEKIAEFAEVKKARNAEVSQTLESILVHGDKDFLFDNSGSKVPVSELVGKNIILYFSANRESTQINRSVQSSGRPVQSSDRSQCQRCRSVYQVARRDEVSSLQINLVQDINHLSFSSLTFLSFMSPLEGECWNSFKFTAEEGIGTHTIAATHHTCSSIPTPTDTTSIQVRSS